MHPENIEFIVITLEVFKSDKSNETKFLQSLNIPVISLILELLNFGNLINVIFVQLLNMLSILLISPVFKLDRSIGIKFIHELNIFLIFLIFEAGCLNISTDFKLKQFENILSMSCTELIFKLESKFSNFEQDSNIKFIFTTFEVLKFVKSTDVILEQPWNILSIEPREDAFK